MAPPQTELIRAAELLAGGPWPPAVERVRKVREALAAAILPFAGQPNTQEVWAKVFAAVQRVIDLELLDVPPEAIPDIHIHLFNGEPGRVETTGGEMRDRRTATPLALTMHDQVRSDHLEGEPNAEPDATG